MIDTIPEMAAALAEKGAEVFLSGADRIDPGAVTAFLATRPLQSRRDPAWEAYLTGTGAAMFSFPKCELAVLGFDDSVSPHILEEEGPVVGGDGMADFAVLSLEFSDAPLGGRYVDIGFTFAVAPTLGAGVYKRGADGTLEPFAADFRAWTQKMVDLAPRWDSLVSHLDQAPPSP